jgi:hypothetical protein
MKTIIDKNTGKVLYTTAIDVELQENQMMLNKTITEEFVKPFYNFETELFYETATFEEIAEAKKPEVPLEVPLWRVRVILKLIGKEEIIEQALNQLEEPTRTAAMYIWQHGNVVERNSNTVLFLQSVIEMTNEEVDNIFIQANLITL